MQRPIPVRTVFFFKKKRNDTLDNLHGLTATNDMIAHGLEWRLLDAALRCH